MGDAEAGRVAEVERKLRRLEEETARRSAALRQELRQVQRVQELEAQLHELEARHAVETAELRRELELARGGAAAREIPPLRRDLADLPQPPPTGAPVVPPLLPFVLWYQLPTLCVAVVLLPLPLFVVLIGGALLVAMLIAALVSYALERRRALLGAPGDPGRGLALHQLAPLLLLQPVIGLYAYVAASFSLSASHAFRVDDFVMMLAMLEAGYVLLVVPTVLLVPRAARKAARR